MEIAINRSQMYIAGAVIVVAATILWMVFRPAAIQVETAAVVRSTLLDTIDAEGRTRVKNKFTVTAPVSGKLKRITLKEGDNILRNYPITEIDPNPPIPRAPTMDTSMPNPYAARIFAPASGRVLRILEKSERFLEVGTPLLEIGDPTQVEIVVDVLSTDAVRIKPGIWVLIEDGNSGQPIRAQVRTIEPQAVTKVSALGVEEKRVDVVADFVAAKPSLGDNFRLDVRIVVWQGENVLCVPNTALFRSGNEWRVFVVESGRAQLRSIEIGHRSSTETQVVSGLTEGDIVVVHPPRTLAEGSRVAGE